jgi:hypothetical protein
LESRPGSILESAEEHAIYCAVRSLDGSLVRDIADLLCGLRKPEDIAARLKAAADCSHLLRHASITAALVCRLVDLVPEEQLSDLVNWTLDRAMTHPWNRSSAEILQNIWKSLSQAAWRFDGAQSKRVAESVLKHPFATEASRYRLRRSDC